MTHHAIIVCKSVHHGNTRLVADRIARAIGAEVVEPESVMLGTPGEFSLLGVGSGIYYGRFHRSIRDWLRKVPKNGGQGRRVFLFSTSGLPFLSWAYHALLRRSLKRKGFEIVGEFSCRGHDTFFALALIGGLNRKHPNEQDLDRAESFANSLPHTHTASGR